MLNVDFIKLKGILEMAGILVALIITIFFAFVAPHKFDDWSDDIVRPWEKEERRAARKAKRGKRCRKATAKGERNDLPARY